MQRNATWPNEYQYYCPTKCMVSLFCPIQFHWGLFGKREKTLKGLLERGLNSTGVNGDGRAIIKGGGAIKLFLVSMLYFRRGCGYYVLRNILERGPYLLLCASPCCIGPSRWWILICWGWLDTCLTGCRNVLRRVIQIVFNRILNVT